MRANKITNNGEVLLDLTQDTATPETVGEGVTFHTADGSPAVGTAKLGGAELNIAYGDVPPEDTSKLWVKTTEASAVEVSGETLTGDGLRPASVESVVSGEYSTYYPAMAMVDGKVYIFGGGTSGDKNTIKVFDPYVKTVTTLAKTLPNALGMAGCGAVGKNIFLFGGNYSEQVQSTLYMFDTVEQTVTDLSDVYTGHIGSSKPLKQISCATVGDVIYLFGGIGANSGAVNKEIYRFDGVNKTFLGSGVNLPNVTSSLCICSPVGDKIYVFSGDKEGAIYCYDIHAMTVDTLTTTMPMYSKGASCCTIDGKVYFVGVSDSGLSNKIYCFDPSTEEVSEVYTSSTTIRYGFGIVPFEHGAYYFGGNNSSIWNFRAPIESMPLDNGTLKICAAIGVNPCQIVNTDTFKAAIGVKEVYKGNADNEGEKVEAAVYQYGAWTSI